MQSKIATLKKKMQCETRLSLVVEYFVKHVAVGNTLMAQSKPVQNQLLQQFLLPMLMAHLRVGLSEIESAFYQHKGSTLIHGCVVSDDVICGCLYFTDIHLGVIQVDYADPGKASDYFQFSAVPLPHKHKVQQNALDGSVTLH